MCFDIVEMSLNKMLSNVRVKDYVTTSYCRQMDPKIDRMSDFLILYSYTIFNNIFCYLFHANYNAHFGIHIIVSDGN